VEVVVALRYENLTAPAGIAPDPTDIESAGRRSTTCLFAQANAKRKVGRDERQKEFRGLMVSVFILVFSLVALIRFGVLYCRGILLRTAAQVSGEQITGRDFAALAGVLSMTPGGSGGVSLVKAYFRVVKLVGAIGRTQVACAAWAEREMAICARYVGAQIDGRLQMCFAEQAGR
jgi:hypothetical protein